MAQLPSEKQGIVLIVEAFLTDRRSQNLSPGTLHFYQVKLQRFCEFCHDQLITDLTQVTPDTIRKFLLALQDNHSAGGVHAYYRSLKTFIRWWIDEYDVDIADPFKKMRTPKLPELVLPPLAMVDLEKLLEVAGVRDRAILFVLADCGIRASELLGLDLADLDLPGSALLIRAGKGRKFRYVFFGKRTRRSIRAWLRHRGIQTGALFVSRYGERLTYFGLRSIVVRLAKQAEIPTPALHSFRRLYCLNSLQAGVDVVSLSRLMGHAGISLISKYAKQSAGNLRELYRSPLDQDAQ